MSAWRLKANYLGTEVLSRWVSRQDRRAEQREKEKNCCCVRSTTRSTSMGQRSLAGTSESAGPCVHVHVGSGQVLGLGRHQLNTDVWHGVAADAAVTSKAQRRGNAHLVQLRGNVHAFISSLSFHQCLVFPDRPQRPQPATLPTQHAAPVVSFLLPDQPPLMASQFDTAYHALHLGIAVGSGERSTGLSTK